MGTEIVLKGLNTPEDIDHKFLGNGIVPLPDASRRRVYYKAAHKDCLTLESRAESYRLVAIRERGVLYKQYMEQEKVKQKECAEFFGISVEDVSRYITISYFLSVTELATVAQIKETLSFKQLLKLATEYKREQKRIAPKPSIEEEKELKKQKAKEARERRKAKKEKEEAAVIDIEECDAGSDDSNEVKPKVDVAPVVVTFTPIERKEADVLIEYATKLAARVSKTKKALSKEQYALVIEEVLKKLEIVK